MKEAETAKQRFTTKIRIYWSDCDPAGIAYYGNFFRWFEMAEEELFLSLGLSRTDIFRQYSIGLPARRGLEPLPQTDSRRNPDRGHDLGCETHEHRPGDQRGNPPGPRLRNRCRGALPDGLRKAPGIPTPSRSPKKSCTCSGTISPRSPNTSRKIATEARRTQRNRKQKNPFSCFQNLEFFFSVSSVSLWLHHRSNSSNRID